MSNLRRYHQDGNIYFITCVTFRRKPLLIENSDLLLRTIRTIRERTPFDLTAWVVMPDHFHSIIYPTDTDISAVLQRIKMSFGVLYRRRHGLYSGRVWQNRFWDHIIRDQEDMNRHIDYIHYNPVKHSVAADPYDWADSSIHEFAREGTYQPDWGEIGRFGNAYRLGE
jgi:putative transposase